MQARMKNPAMLVPGAVPAIQALIAATQSVGVPAKVLHLAHLRASQINGCSFCVDIGAKHAKQDGETDERLHAVAGWREAPYFTEAERAALSLSEAVTSLDPRDPVPDSVWDNAARHFGEKQLAALVLWIATVNLFNRANIATRQPAGTPIPKG
ncbi:MAG: carboxymuconolactone decarboxylase family protein [Proteobacteria bacterium]|nr:carboxymuconolactone decarboxylase family protein [Pseudomonadota bacterium]